MSDKKTIYQSLGIIPQQITIGENKYTFKKNININKYSYRCIHSKCPVLITITKEELPKINNNNNQNQISIEYQNKYDLSIHKNKVTTTENIDNISFIKSTKDLEENLIKASLNKPLEWHITNIQK